MTALVDRSDTEPEAGGDSPPIRMRTRPEDEQMNGLRLQSTSLLILGRARRILQDIAEERGMSVTHKREVYMPDGIILNAQYIFQGIAAWAQDVRDALIAKGIELDSKRGVTIELV